VIGVERPATAAAYARRASTPPSPIVRAIGCRAVLVAQDHHAVHRAAPGLDGVTYASKPRRLR
jgi:hypothetical protein